MDQLTYSIPVTESLLNEITQRIVNAFDPDKIVLFGSHATGSPRADSDIDLLVIMDVEGPAVQRAIQVKRVCRPRFVAMDVLVKTASEVAKQLDRGDLILRQILEQGKLLYERHP